MKFLKGALCGALAMLLVTGLASCNLNFNGSKKEPQAISNETEKKLKVLEQLIDQNYLGEVDEEELQSGIYEGYISGLEDPYSVYYDEEATKSLMESTSGEYDGVGAVMTQNRETGVITFSQVYENSPAEKAGIKDGDILYKVEGKKIKDDFKELFQLLKDVYDIADSDAPDDSKLTELEDKYDEIDEKLTKDGEAFVDAAEKAGVDDDDIDDLVSAL